MKYITLKELAMRWRCSIPALRNKIRRGELDYVMLMGRIVFDIAEIEKIEQSSVYTYKN